MRKIESLGLFEGDLRSFFGVSAIRVFWASEFIREEREGGCRGRRREGVSFRGGYEEMAGNVPSYFEFNVETLTQIWVFLSGNSM